MSPGLFVQNSFWIISVCTRTILARLHSFSARRSSALSFVGVFKGIISESEEAWCASAKVFSTKAALTEAYLLHGIAYYPFDISLARYCS